MSHSPATPSEWEPDAEATHPLPDPGEDGADAATGDPGDIPADETTDPDAAAEPQDAPEPEQDVPEPEPHEWQPDADASWQPGEEPVESDGWDPETEAPQDAWGDEGVPEFTGEEGPGEFIAADEFAERDEVETAADSPDDEPAPDHAEPEETPAAEEAALDETTVLDPTESDTPVAVLDETSVLALGDTDPDSVAPTDPTAFQDAQAIDAPVPAASEDAAADAAGPEASAGGSDEASEGQANPRRPLIILAAGLAVLLIVAGIVWAVISTANSNRDKAIAQTATTYLTAIADADAQAALATLADKPANTALLTGEVLAASRTAAPLTDIQVGAPAFDGGTAATILATYKLGDQAVSTTLRLEGDGRTQWLLSDGTADLNLSSTGGLQVNTATLTEATNPVFPGTYTAATTTPDVALDGTPTVVVSTPDAEAATLAVTPTLSEAGKTNVLTAVKSRFDECLAATEARPANCPFGVRTDDVEVTPGSVKFALVNDPWAGFAPSLDAATLSATGQFPYVIDATATVAQNGLTTEGTTRIERPVTYTVDLSKSPLAVVWS